MRNHFRIVAVAAALASAGCSLIVDPAAKDPMASPEGFCNSVQDAYAKVVPTCYGVDPTYVDDVLSAFRIGCENVGTADAQGLIGYDKSLAEQCMSMLDSTDCYSIGEVFQFCTLALPGQVPAGGDCTAAYSDIQQCEGNAFCYFSAGTCPGTCVAPGALGQPCATVGAQCAAGLVCDGNGLCATPGSYGASCANPNPPCNPSYYYCNSSGICDTLPPYGTTVDCSITNYQCYTGYICAYSSIAGGYRCVTPAAHGEDCSLTNYQCVAGDYCRYDSSISGYRCWTIPSTKQAVGGDCSYRGNQDCLTGLYCDWLQNYTCQPLLAEGATCTSSSPCGPGSTCSKLDSEPSGTCMKLKGNGAVCRAGAEECLQGLSCIGTTPGSVGICRPYGGPGSACGYLYYQSTSAYNESVRCAFDAWCQDSGGLTGTCAATVPAGGSCLIGGILEWSACGQLTGAQCDGNAASPTYGTCVVNQCTQPFGWFGGGAS